MARQETTNYFDDIDGRQLTEDDLNVVRFSIDGQSYLIDLSEENADKFRELLAPYISVARRDLTADPRRKAGKGGNRYPETRKIRQWALDQGKDVALRGKLPADIIDAYYKQAA